MIIQTEMGALTFDPEVGNIPELNFRWQGQTLTPLHVAPWTKDPDAQDATDVPLVDRKLAGDFVCAPFGKSDVEHAPPHGWPANSRWTVSANGPGWLEATLDRPVMGARITKKLSLRANAPVLVQTHVIEGGEGGLTFSHHPMIDVSGGARLSCSAKRLALTIENPIVPGHHAFALGARARDIAALPTSDKRTVDVRDLPIGNDTEDFVTLIDEATTGLGWTAVVRARENDIVFVLKDLSVLPVTMLWHSNGARKDFPWNGRNRGVLGIEDGRAAGAAGHAAALRENPISVEGVPTMFELTPGTRHTIRHVLGAIPNAQDWREVMNIRMEKHAIALDGDNGVTIRLPFQDYSLFGNSA